MAHHHRYRGGGKECVQLEKREIERVYCTAPLYLVIKIMIIITEEKSNFISLIVREIENIHLLLLEDHQNSVAVKENNIVKASGVKMKDKKLL